MGEGPIAALLWKPQEEMGEVKPVLCEGTDRFQLLGRLAKYSSSVHSLVVSDLHPAFWDGGGRSLERRAWRSGPSSVFRMAVMLEHWHRGEHRFVNGPVFYDDNDAQWDSVDQSVGWDDQVVKMKSDSKAWSALGAVPEGQEHWPERRNPECIAGECACY